MMQQILKKHMDPKFHFLYLRFWFSDDTLFVDAVMDEDNIRSKDIHDGNLFKMKYEIK